MEKKHRALADAHYDMSIHHPNMNYHYDALRDLQKGKTNTEK